MSRKELERINKKLFNAYMGESKFGNGYWDTEIAELEKQKAVLIAQGIVEDLPAEKKSLGGCGLLGMFSKLFGKA